MDGRLAQPTFTEAVESEHDADEFVIGIQCHGCDYSLWTHVRPDVPTRIQCFRAGCKATVVMTASVIEKYH